MDVLVAFVLGTRPRVTETATGYVVTVPHGRKAFIILSLIHISEPTRPY